MFVYNIILNREGVTIIILDVGLDPTIFIAFILACSNCIYRFVKSKLINCTKQTIFLLFKIDILYTFSETDKLTLKFLFDKWFFLKQFN